MTGEIISLGRRLGFFCMAWTCICVCRSLSNMACAVHLSRWGMVPRGCAVGCDIVWDLCLLDSEALDV